MNAGDKYTGWTALHRVSETGNLYILDQLLGLASHLEVSAKNKYESTPLHVAAQLGHSGVVRCLLEAGADVKARNRMAMTPLISAVSQAQMAKTNGKKATTTTTTTTAKRKDKTISTKETSTSSPGDPSLGLYAHHVTRSID